MEVLEQALSGGSTGMDNIISFAIQEFAKKGRTSVASRIARLAARHGKRVKIGGKGMDKTGKRTGKKSQS